MGSKPFTPHPLVTSHQPQVSSHKSQITHLRRSSTRGEVGDGNECVLHCTYCIVYCTVNCTVPETVIHQGG